MASNIYLEDASSRSAVKRLAETQRSLWAAEAKIRDLVDHIAMLRSPQVTTDNLLLDRIAALEKEGATLRRRLLTHHRKPGMALRRAAVEFPIAKAS